MGTCRDGNWYVTCNAWRVAGVVVNDVPAEKKYPMPFGASTKYPVEVRLECVLLLKNVFSYSSLSRSTPCPWARPPCTCRGLSFICTSVEYSLFLLYLHQLLSLLFASTSLSSPFSILFYVCVCE